MTVVDKGKIESVHPQAPNRVPVHELDEPKSALDEPMSWSNWYRHVHWIQATLLVTTPFIALYGALYVPLQAKTLVWSAIYYFYTGLGITGGYHRLWSHRSYTASRPFQLFLLCGASGAVQGSLRWWCRNHRAHHRYTDTDDDPYGAHKGLFWSHIGWMLVKQNPKRVGRVDITDLNADWLVRFQHKWYIGFVLTFGLLFPMTVAGLGWGDWRGGFFFAAIARLVAVHHATFCVNSLAHYLGDTPFDDKHTPRDHFITAFMTLGEGYHNFHHEFPQDYRNAIRFYQYDPTKWVIRFSSLFGLVSQLKKFPENEVRKGIVLMKQKGLDKEKAKLDWGIPINQLPVLTFEEFEEKAQTQSLILIEGVVHDVTEFMDEHPGGRGYLKTAVGRDMTTAFNGGVYNHSNAAHNLLSKFRVAVVSGGGEVESRKMNGHHPKFE